MAILTPLTAKVALIQSSGDVVINKGRVDGVKIGDNFLVFGLGPNIVDPDTKEDLGAIEIIRGKAKVSHVQDRIATLTSVEQATTSPSKRIVRRDPATGSIGLLIGRGSTIEEITEPSGLVHLPLDNPKIGDFARQF
jgi:hypothetical protein